MELEKFLLEMRREQRDDHERLVEKVDAGFLSISTSMAKHELDDTKAFNTIDSRLVIVENMRRTIRWLAVTTVGGGIAATADYLINHLFAKH